VQEVSSGEQYSAPPILPADRHCARYKLSYRIKVIYMRRQNHSYSHNSVEQYCWNPHYMSSVRYCPRVLNFRYAVGYT